MQDTNIKIEKIEYHELFTFDYDNFKAGAVCEILPGSCPDEAFKELKEWVQNKLKDDSKRYMSMKRKMQEKYDEISMLNMKIVSLMHEIRYQEKYLEMFGMPEYTDIPF